ncbi:MAG: nucleotidyl transferase AbiEii/AbiGii toxin family protein [Parvibaculaceae bacterium]
MSPGSGKWPTSGWRGLLSSALSLLDTLEEKPQWTFGGGTSLAVHYDHRISHDIDIFVSSSETVSSLAPNRNSATRALVAGRSYEFPGNYLKLQMEDGEIDFIVGSKRTSVPTQPWQFEDRTILIDTPWETATKKMFHRPSTFKIRDVFDLAAVIDHDGGKLEASLPEIADRLDRLIDRIDALVPVYEQTAEADINPTGNGRKYMGTRAIVSVMDFLRRWKEKAP